MEKREGEQECGENIDGICFIMSHSIVVTRKKMIAYNWLDGLISKAVTLKINCSFPIFSIKAISRASIFGISLCRHRWSCANARCELFSNLWLYHWVRGDSSLRLLVFHLFCVHPVSRLQQACIKWVLLRIFPRISVISWCKHNSFDGFAVYIPFYFLMTTYLKTEGSINNFVLLIYLPAIPSWP